MYATLSYNRETRNQLSCLPLIYMFVSYEKTSLNLKIDSEAE